VNRSPNGIQLLASSVAGTMLPTPRFCQSTCLLRLLLVQPERAIKITVPISTEGPPESCGADQT
jgi:hypothetical protein